MLVRSKEAVDTYVIKPKVAAADMLNTFTADEAEGILAIEELNAYNSVRAAVVLDSLPPDCFSEAQVQCIRQMLLLKHDEFLATLADAMEPCELRDRLRMGSQVMRSS